MEKQEADTASWMILPWSSTLISAAMIVFASLVAYSTYVSPLNPKAPPPRWAGMIAVVVIASFSRSCLAGGCTCDFENRQVIRWWGPCFPIRSLQIPFGEIWRISISGGKRSKIHGHVWYRIEFQTMKMAMVIRGFKDGEAAINFANALAAELGLPLADLRNRAGIA